MSEHARLLRALWESTTAGWRKKKRPSQPEPDVLLQRAKREMEEVHARNRERAVQAITTKNNLQQMVDDLEFKVQQLREKALAAEVNQDWSRALQLRHEQTRYEESLVTTRESLKKAIETSEVIKNYIQREQQTIREKTTELLALHSQWKSSALQQEIEEHLHAKVQCIFEEGYTLYPLKAVQDLVGVLLAIIAGLLLILLFVALH